MILRSFLGKVRTARQIVEREGLSPLRAASLVRAKPQTIAQFRARGCTCEWIMTPDGRQGVVRFDRQCPVLDAHHFDPDKTVTWIEHED